MFRKVLKGVAGAAVLFLAGSQFFPPERTNPASDPAASFDAAARPSKEAAAVVGRACKDCHSHDTVWPWYSRVSPVSWLIAGDVREGRARLNLSEWGRFGPEMARLRMEKMCEAARVGEMPPWYYTPLHPGARLSGRDVAALCAPPAP